MQARLQPPIKKPSNFLTGLGDILVSGATHGESLRRSQAEAENLRNLQNINAILSGSTTPAFASKEYTPEEIQDIQMRQIASLGTPEAFELTRQQIVTPAVRQQMIQTGINQQNANIEMAKLLEDRRRAQQMLDRLYPAMTGDISPEVNVPPQAVLPRPRTDLSAPGLAAPMTGIAPSAQDLQTLPATDLGTLSPGLPTGQQPAVPRGTLTAPAIDRRTQEALAPLGGGLTAAITPEQAARDAELQTLERRNAQLATAAATVPSLSKSLEPEIKQNDKRIEAIRNEQQEVLKSQLDIQKEQQKQVSKERIGRVDAINANASGGRDFLRKVSRLEKVFADLGSGTGAIQGSGVGRGLGAGLNTRNERLRRVAEQIISDMELDVAKLKLKGQGAITESERKIARATLPRLTNEPETNLQILNDLKDEAQLALERQKGFKDSKLDIDSFERLYPDDYFIKQIESSRGNKEQKILKFDAQGNLIQ